MPNPFEPEVAPLVFRTGDLGRYGADGRVEFIGRLDTQVKIRGQRVEPSEVECALRDFETVDNALVTAIVDSDQGHQLVAYITTNVGDFDLRGLRRHLADQLPSSMVPTYIVPLAKLPLLGSGKLDRASVRAELRERRAELGPLAPPEDELERRIVRIWSMVLAVDEVSIDDNFLDLGGDSLKAMLLRIALEAELKIPVSLAILAQSPTVRELAAELRGAQ